MNELVVANNHLKTQLALPCSSGSQGMDEVRINELRDELTSERNSKLKTWADYETKMWQYASDLREKETRIKDGKAMIDELRGELVDAQNELNAQNDLKRKSSLATLRARVLPDTMSFSAGIPPLDAASQHREEVLTDEVQQWKDEVGIYKAWIRQMDDMYNEELRASSQSRGRSQEREQKKIEDKSPSDKDLYYPKKPGPPGPPGPPNDPGDGGGGASS